MVNAGLIALGLIILVIAVIGLPMILKASATQGKVNDVPTVNDALSQLDLGVNPSISTQGLLGFAEGQTNANSSVEDIKANILSNNLTSEESIRKLVNDELNKTQVSTISGGKGTQTTELKGVTLFADENSELKVLQAFAPAGEGEFLSIRGTPLAENAVSRTEETFSGVITTKDGGTREIRGSKALFDRLQQNLQKSSI
jgi:hypothetical protein